MEWNNNVKVVSFMLHCDCESIRFFVTTFISARMFDLKIRNKYNVTQILSFNGQLNKCLFKRKSYLGRKCGQTRYAIN